MSGTIRVVVAAYLHWGRRPGRPLDDEPSFISPAKISFRNQTGVSFETYCQAFIIGRQIPDISLPNGWYYRVLDDPVGIRISVFPAHDKLREYFFG